MKPDRQLSKERQRRKTERKPPFKPVQHIFTRNNAKTERASIILPHPRNRYNGGNGKHKAAKRWSEA